MSEQQSDLEEAIANVTTDPKQEALWDQIEDLAGQLDDPESVVAAYRTTLGQAMSGDEAVTLGERAVNFHREWFGDDLTGLAMLLTRVLELNPKSEWAFQELTVALTVAERWDDVIKLYQDVIANTTAKPRLIRLLDEAYQVSKDLANRPDQAIDFLKAKLELKPSAKQLVALERLLERHERWTDLIELWSDALDSQNDDERIANLTQIAATYFDKLANGQEALESLRDVFSDDQRHEAALDLLERIATSEDNELALREAALTTVREVYEGTDRPSDIVRVLGEVLPLCDDAQRRGLHAELGERLSALEEHAAALDHYTALLILDPASVATQRALRREAQLTDRLDRYASALASAADAAADAARRVALLSEAALTLLDLADGENAAIDLLMSTLATEGIHPTDVLNVGKRLNLLLDRAERHGERLTVLERLADAESVESSRRALIGDVAELAETLGEVDRALAAWRRRIESNSGDLRALEHLIELLGSEERWPELIEALSARREQAIPNNQKRSDLIRIANIYEKDLEQSDQALATWSAVKEQYGEDPETVAALSRLMTSLEQWGDLTSLLEGSNAQQVAYLADQFAHLGNAYQQSLGDNARAIECYRRALTVDVRHSGAQEGLKLLLEIPELRNEVAEALVHSMKSSGNLVGLLDIVDARISGTEDERKHAEILREAADIAEAEAEDNKLALGFVTRLFPMTARDRVLEDRMLRLARGCEEWESALEAYGKAQDIISEDSFALAAMRFRQASVRENEIEDVNGALQCVLLVVGAQPDNHEAVGATIRLAGPQGEMSHMVGAMLGYASARQVIPEDLLSSITGFADHSDGGYEKLCSVLSESLAESGLESALQAEMHWRIAGWQESKLENQASALQSMLASTELDRGRVDTFSKLAQFQSEDRNAALYATMRRLCEIDAAELSHFQDAAEIALDALGSEQQEESLTALQGRAIGAWRGSAPAQSETAPQEIVAWTIEKLVAHYVESEQAQRALDLLIDASRLPFDEATCLDMRKRAATLASDVLQDPASAIDMYRAVLAQAPDDGGALDALGSLYEQQNRLPELLGLKRQGLGYEEDAERSIAMRLEISGLIDEIDRKGGRLQLLRENLSAAPGHDASIEAVATLLSSMGKFSELCSLLGEQAETLESKTEIPKAAQLWGRVAYIAEIELGDIEQALEAFRKVANLAPNLQALDSLARLYISRSQSGAAVPWLEQAMGLAEEAERPSLVKRLAEAHLAAEHPAEAIACLDAATADGEASLLELRTMLADLHREARHWQPLADALTASLPHITNDEAVAEAAREAADIYHEKLLTPEAAVPALARALEIVPDDRGLRLMMARSQRVAGEVPAARQMLEALVAEFGRRRSKERAAVHVELAQVARAEADLESAMAELELASKMDGSNAHILKALADLAREQGDFDQAERSLRGLLLIVRRYPPGEDENAVGIGEVLFELHHIAAVRDDEDKAEELLDSVIEAASSSDAEVRRLRRTLLEHKEFDLLAQVLRSRIKLSEDTTSKAGLLGLVADLLEEPLQDAEGALDARLQCVALLPQEDSLHDSAKELATKLSSLPKYLKSLEEMVARQRRTEEAELTNRLLMRAGGLAEDELGDLDKAREHYAAAEECSSAPADALFALARVCAAQGDSEEQTRALDKLTTLAMVDGPVAAQADALYRLAELQVVQPDLLERGLEVLTKALEVEPRYRQAALTLKAAAESSNNDPGVLAHYESVARHSGDKPILLDFLERQSAGSEATVSQIREAVNLASELEKSDRAVVLLERAVQTARVSDDGLSQAIWAASDLARHYGANERISDAKELLFEIAYLATQEDIMELGLELAEQSKAGEELSLTAEILEFLRGRDPNARAIWEPLLALYRDAGNGEELSALVDATLPSLVDPSERTQLRLHKAHYLIDTERDDDAINVLRDACLDDPDSIDAAELLETVLRKEGNEEALSDFLWQRFNDAKDRGNPETVTDVAVRLGALLDQIDGGSMQVYQQALAVAPQSAALLRGILDRLGENTDLGERAELSERLLQVEEPERAADLALALVELREVLEDNEGVQRALVLGQQACPTHEGIRVRLEGWYRETAQWRPLAQMKVNQAEAEESVEDQVRLFREAGTLYRDSLEDLESCSGILARALELAPADEALVAEQASTHAAAGRMDEGIATVATGLEHIEGPSALPLLLLRADLYRNAGRNADAIADLESGLAMDREMVEPVLMQTLEHSRVSASSSGEFELERATTMRLIELYDAQGNEEGARAMLLAWIERDTQDLAALQRLRDTDRAAERWDGVVSACTHLVGLETGEQQVSSALLLADAADKIEASEHGRAGLERTHQDQPENPEVRMRLRGMYEASGSRRELANLLLIDATYSNDDDERYEILRSAASIFVNELADAEAAIAPAQAAKELRPDDHATVVLLADVLITSGQIDEAIAMLEPAIAAHKRRSPELAALQYRMSKIGATQGNQEEQLAWLKKAFDVDRKDGLIASELAHLATEVGDYDLALKPLRAITLMEDPEPLSRVMALLWEAKIEHARGNRAKAELWAKKALREDPAYSEAQDFLAQIAE
ncbi:MAG: tetratricopeptide repeat protein [Myxococcales bacterium]|nr:tetratricopeptide repeat protein [Myxococcales bacterium]